MALKSLMRRAASSATRSRLRKRPNVRRARRGYLPSGGVRLGPFLGTPCARIAGKSARPVDGRLLINRANYRKYGVISFTKAEDSKKPPEKLEPKTKKQKVGHGLTIWLTRQIGDTSSTATPAPPPPPKLPPCSFCRKNEPKASMARCKTCTFSVHSGESPTWKDVC